MDLAAIETFITVAKMGSFSAAAKQLHLSQPAVSKRISALERFLECDLFSRVGNKVILSDAGRIMQHYGRQIVFDLHSCRQDINNLADSQSGDLILATSHHVALHHLRSGLKTCRKRYPGINIEFRFLDSEDTYQAILDGEVEIAVATLSPNPVAQIQALATWNDPLTLAYSDTWTNKSPLQLSKLAAILPAKNTFTRQLIDRALKLQHVNYRQVKEVNNLETIKMLVSAGIGWSALPKMMIKQEGFKATLPEFTIQRQLGVICHSKRALSNTAKIFIQLLLQDKSP